MKKKKSRKEAQAPRFYTQTDWGEVFAKLKRGQAVQLNELDEIYGKHVVKGARAASGRNLVVCSDGSSTWVEER